MAKKTSALTLGIFGSIAATTIWTMLTGALWPWIPVIGGIVISLSAAKAVQQGSDKK